MGFHNWFEQCPCCDFENMLVSSYRDIYFDVICPVCGYSRWTEEKIPQNEDIELAKETIREMNSEERESVIELYREKNVPLIDLQKDKPLNQG